MGFWSYHHLYVKFALRLMHFTHVAPCKKYYKIILVNKYSISLQKKLKIGVLNT